MFAKTLTAAAALAFASASMAQDSAALARMSAATWAAFQCSALAGMKRGNPEAMRLLDFGYKQGKTFFEALRAGKIKEADVNEYVPVIVLWQAGGAPTDDFALGRIYQTAHTDVLKDVYGDPKKSDEVELAQVARKFEAMNCLAIGVGP